MARKTKTVTITADNRDKGRRYLITEMSAGQSERWASRWLTALTNSNPELSGIEATGMAGVAALGLKTLAGIPWEDAEPLLAEMLTCVEFIPDAARPSVVRPLIEDDTEEVTTRLLLRAEVIELHTGFSVTAALSKLGVAFQTVLRSQTIPTSPAVSA